MMMLKFAGVALAMAFTAPVFAADCATTVEGNDAMQYNTKSISVPQSCKEFTVTLKHTGKMPKAAMGHNWVLTKTADMQSVATAGMSAGVAKDYVKSDDARVIAYTKLIGGGETTSVSFDPAKLSASESYTFFCSAPGHSSIMKGTVQLTK